MNPETATPDRLWFEERLWREGKNFIAGVDEVGRGPLAGPVMAGAVIFDKYYFISGIRDSKKLSVQKRIDFAARIKEEALCWAVGSASVEEIDRYNIRRATFMAMHRALVGLTIQPDFILVDGENLPETTGGSLGIIGGDDKSFTIAAASIVAKVERDRLMQELDHFYPVYRFAKNKGYGTREHIVQLHRYGPSVEHRRSFLKRILPGDSGRQPQDIS